MKWLEVAGIALSISLMYLVSCAYLMFVSLRLLKGASEDAGTRLAVSPNVS